MATVDDSAMQNVLQTIARSVNSLSDDNRNSRKVALIAINKELFKNNTSTPSVIQKILLGTLIKPYLKLLSDPVEKCRSLSLSFIKDCFDIIEDKHEVLRYVVPVMVLRLGQKEVVEPSEEIRLFLVEFLECLIINCSTQISPYLDDIVTILQRTIVDSFPEVKKTSCKCCSAAAKTMPQQFHMRSENLIEPLLLTISHQHSRVRVQVILAIGKSYNFIRNFYIFNLIAII